MKFTSFASSSRGNAYLLQSEGAPPLLLEAGLSISRLRDKLREHGISLSDLGGCLVSHEHQDHAKAVKDLLKVGMDIWTSEGTARTLGVMEHHRLHTIFREAFYVEDWWIIPFDLEHDAANPKGFFIAHGGERLLFIPDTAYIENRFQGVTILVIECNNAEDILSEKVLIGVLPALVARRIRRNHMSLRNVKELILANNMARTLREIWLIHLSDTNSSEQRFKKEIQELTGVPVYICEE
jgi:phosphoribosyl 1,2-cyclic phosphodiesterase